MIKTLSVLIMFVLTFIGVKAQNDHAILVIGDHTYSAEEFSYIYNKNNSFETEKRTKKEYVDLFVNYKLKVVEAQAMGLDTLPSFLKEYNYYKKEVAKPYLTDSEVTDHLLHEAYDRLKYEVDASHILLKVAPDALPDDTLKVYNKLLDIKKQIEEGASFEEMAVKYSEDPSAIKNKGRLGYFKGFMMVYPFETGAYETEVGQLSDIVRTRFGYHLIKVHDKRAERGQLKTAHIMMMFPRNASADLKASKKAKIDSIYQLVLRGDDFGALAATYSEDRNTANKNGELPWFGSGQMIPEFSDPAYALDSVHNISKVVESPYGYHIIKLLDRKSLEPYDQMEESLKKKIQRDERAFKGTESLVAKLKSEYKYTEDEAGLSLLKSDAADASLTEDAFIQKLESAPQVLATFATDTINTIGLANYLNQHKKYTRQMRLSDFVSIYDAYVQDEIMTYEEAHLEEKYPDYKFLLDEYHDGLLIFELSQQKIWNKANEDTLAVANYYNDHASQYFTPEKLEGEIIFCKNKKDYKAMAKKAGENPTSSLEEIKQQLNLNDVKLIKGTFTRGEYKGVDEQVWNDKSSEGAQDNEYPFVYARGEELPKAMLPFEKTKGQVIADYQNYLEQEWIKELKQKYKPIVQSKALKYVK